MPPENALSLEGLVRHLVGIDMASLGSSIRDRIDRAASEVTDTDGTFVRVLEEACSVPETYFFRHREQWTSVASLAPNLPRALRGEPIRAWSAGTATGEEAYSIAQTLLAATGLLPDVLGTDMNGTALERARSARYGLWSLREFDPDYVDAVFESKHPDYLVRSDVRACVRFEHLNLVLDEYPTELDLIFCRNVFLYFDEEAAKLALRRMHASLSPGGLLVLGPYDPASAAAASLFETVHGIDGVYRRPVEPRVHDRSPSSPRPQAAPPESFVGHDSPTTKRRDARAESRPLVDGSEMASEVMRTIHEGRTVDATRLYEAHRVAHPLAPELHVAGAIALFESGSLDAALGAARAAYFLAPTRSFTKAVFGIALNRLGHRARAVPLLREARDAMAPDESIRGLDPLDLRLLVDAELGGVVAT